MATDRDNAFRDRKDVWFQENPESVATDEELYFIFAMELWKEFNGTKFPRWSEVLEVLHSLGYRKENGE